ncbi:MAG: PKD domain-containing protein [Saprospiraceae bacterium]|nr:PKD domain-containing protein [Saprospiraceae bacterium]
MYTLLLTPEGIINMGKQDIDPGVTFGKGSVGNAVFSPDGSKYIRHDLYFDPWNEIDIYDFDRCTGKLTHLENIVLNDTSFLYGGSAVSPDSRFLYAVTNKKLYQFDLWATNIEATKTLVGVYDGHLTDGFHSFFGTPQLGPDGKIYVASAVTDSVMHLINTPNQPGLMSYFTQHSVNLPNFNDKSIPNFPNYRLGPLDGSPCDTLGLDNHPMAGFTWFPDELAAAFSDNSYYRPETWAWDFGDGGSGSNERNPLHTFPEPGDYYVCLTVTNEYGSDTHCRWVAVDTVGVVGTRETWPARRVQILPNPASDYIHLVFDDWKAGSFVFQLSNLTGQAVRHWEVPNSGHGYSLNLSGISNGMYIWKIWVDGRPAGVGKLIISK